MDTGSGATTLSGMSHTPTPEGLHTLSGSWGRLSVHEIGATVASWCPGGRERLFTASDAVFSTEAMWHGGIPVCTPWFGQGNGDWVVPHGHGLVSRVRWRTLHAHVDDDSAHVVMVTDAESTRHLPGADRYPADLRYELDVVADAGRLTLGLSVASPSRDAAVELALHPYLRTDARRAVVSGLAGVRYHDHATGTDAVGAAQFGAEGPLDRVFREAPPTIVDYGTSGLRLAAQGANSVIVWNPGPGGDAVPADEWADFVCVEYGAVKAGSVTIPAGGAHLLRMTIRTAVAG